MFSLCLCISVVKDFSFSPEQFIQSPCPLPQWTVNQQFPARIQNIEGKISYRNLPQHFPAHFFPSQALLQHAERPRPSQVRCLRLNRVGKPLIDHFYRGRKTLPIFPRHNLTIENRFLRQARQRARQLRKGLCNLVPRAREKLYLTLRNVRLCPNP